MFNPLQLPLEKGGEKSKKIATCTQIRYDNTMTNDHTKQFLALFERWERYLNVRFGEGNLLDHIRRFWDSDHHICKIHEISENDIKNLYSLRNVCAHTPSFLSIRTDATTIIEKLTSIYCRKAVEIATPGKNTFTATITDPISTVISTMADHSYNYVPVINQDTLVGLFTLKTVLHIKAKAIPTDKKQTLETIKPYLTDTLYSDHYLCVPNTAEFYEVYNLFNEYIDQGKRLGVVIITPHGKPSATIEGLITVADLHKGLP